MPEFSGSLSLEHFLLEKLGDAMQQSLMMSVLGITLTLFVNLEQSRAATIVSNLNDTVAGTGTIYASGPPQTYAQEFTTSSQSVALGSIVAALGTASGTFTASAELLADNSGLPGSTVLTSFVVPSIPATTPTDLTFAPTASVMLSANASYWFALSASGTGSYKWQYTDTLSASVPNYAVSHDDGATWTIGTPAGPFLIAVDSASAVPEHSSFVLAGCAVLLVIVSRRKFFGRA